MDDPKSRGTSAQDALTAHLVKGEAMRRASNTVEEAGGPTLEALLARISAEMTAQATRRRDKPSQEAPESGAEDG